jgi:vacuolar-type H+-ATPase subunit I/STV1
MNTRIRIGLALILGFIIGVVFPLANGEDLLSALGRGFLFSVFLGAIVAVLSWSMDIAEEKGYPGWLGFALVIFLNIIGIIILVLLPSAKPALNK